MVGKSAVSFDGVSVVFIELNVEFAVLFPESVLGGRAWKRVVFLPKALRRVCRGHCRGGSRWCCGGRCWCRGCPGRGSEAALDAVELGADVEHEPVKAWFWRFCRCGHKLDEWSGLVGEASEAFNGES